MRTSPDFIESSERDMVYNLALCEGAKPVSIFAEEHSEELSFTDIFFGQARTSNNKRPVAVTYSEKGKSGIVLLMFKIFFSMSRNFR